MKKKKPAGNFRKIIRQLHLYLALITGLVVFIVATTGCLWVFQEEINDLTSDVPKIEEQNVPFISPTQARNIARARFPENHVHGTLYHNTAAPVEVIFYEPEPEFYQTVFLHPYSGEILKIEDHLSGFFHFILEGHMHLWLPEEVGSQIVAWSTVIFVIMVITGIILWWPKNKRSRKQRFTFDWKKTTKWKRKNYDLHSVSGFYGSLIALVIAVTGLIMTFDWFEKATYQALGGEKEVKFSIPENTSNTTSVAEAALPIDRLLPQLLKKYPQAQDFEIHYPFTDSSSIYVEIAYQDGVFYSADYRFYDQYTLKEISTPSIYGVYDEAGFSEKVIRMNYDTHVGALAGLPGKIIAFLASFICASLPVTGFIMWYGRKFKKKKVRKPSIKTLKEEKTSRAMAS